MTIFNPYFWLGIALACLLSFFGGCAKGAAKWEGKFDAEVAAHKATKRDTAAVLQDLAARTAAVAAQAVAASDTAAQERLANDKKYDKAIDDATQARKDLVAAQRNGALQLHDWWACDRPGASQGDAAALAGGQDGYSDIRSASAAEDVQAGDQADAWIGWLQTELISTRKACGVNP